MADEKVKAGSLVTVKAKNEDKIFMTHVEDDGTLQSKNALVSDIRNLAASLEDSEDKAINVKIANEIVKKITDLTDEVDTSFETVNQNFTNVNNAISQNSNSIETTNQNVTAHEEDSDLHVTAEKQQKWNAYEQSIEEVNTSLNAKMNKPIIITGSLNQVLTTGWYRIPNATDGLPSGYTTENDFYLLVLNVDTKLDFLRYMLFDIRSNKVFTRNVAFGKLGDWEQLATNKLTTTTFSVSEGYTATLNSIKKDSNGRCIIYGIIKKTDGTIFNTDVPLILGVMPQGFIPIYPTNTPVRSYVGNVNVATAPSMLLLDNNGNIVISNTVDNTVEVQFTLMYDTK